MLTAWRYVIRSKDPRRVPLAFLGAGSVLSVLVVVQVLLGSELVWIYGLHTVKVVEAMREGLV